MSEQQESENKLICPKCKKEIIIRDIQVKINYKEEPKDILLRFLQPPVMQWGCAKCKEVMTKDGTKIATPKKEIILPGGGKN